MIETYDKAFDIVVGEEGGYKNDPDDSGGETNWGITWLTLRSAIALGLVPNQTTIKNLTKGQAKLIYKPLYWDMVRGDQVQEPLCIFLFDSAINQGVNPAVRMLQRVLKVPQDGIFGVHTLEVANKATLWHCSEFMAYRALRYTSTRKFDKYGVGWLTRTYSMVFKAAK
jgi:lysozyme family protein